MFLRNFISNELVLFHFLLKQVENHFLLVCLFNAFTNLWDYSIFKIFLLDNEKSTGNWHGRVVNCVLACYEFFVCSLQTL